MNWWLRLWRRDRMEAELERELRFHEDQSVADLVARGVRPDEARRQARLALGGPEQVKEECRDERGTRWLEDLLQDMRYAVRALRRMPGFAAVAVLVLAVGNGATTVMFTVIDSVLLRPLSFPEPERLLTLHGTTEKLGEFWGFSNPDLTDVRRETRSLAVGAWTDGGGTISAPGEPEYVEGLQISADLFPVLGIPVLHGRTFRPDDDRPGAAAVAIISDRLWRRRYGGEPGAIGRPLVFEGKPYTIVGVAPARFELAGTVDVYTPLGQNTDLRMQNREARFIHVLARLGPGATIGEAQAELAVMARRLATEYPGSNAGVEMRAHPLQQDVVGDVGSTLWLLLAAVGLVLLLACVNIASLLLARAASREREFAMRAALGASRSRLVRQCLTESAVLGVSGGALGALLAVVSVRPFVAVWPGSLPRAGEIRFDSSVWLFALTVSLVSSALFGLAPALRMPMHSVERALRTGARSVAGPSRALQSACVIAEVALAVVLLVSAGMLGRTLLTLSSLDPGVNVHDVLTARFALSPAALASPARIRSAWQDVLDRARRVPGVESAALADIIPMREGENTLPYWTTSTPPPLDQAPVALASTVTPDYLNVMGIPLRLGRFFDDHDRADGEPVLVIDDALAQHAFGGDDAVGRRLWVPALSPVPLRIIGVVGHVRHWGLAGDDRSRVRDQMYYPFAQVPASLLRLFSSLMSVAVRTRIPPLNVEETLRRALRGAAGDQALYEVRTMEQLTAASLERQRFLLLLFGIFAGIALLLASVGIYGVLAYLTSQRVPELGVRMALGATARDVMNLVLRQSLSMVAAGVVIGAAAAWGAGRLLARVVEGMRPTELSTAAVMTSVLVAAAMLASVVPARRASRVDVLKALRQE
ncbi:MAG: ADOP family duplicated permease [Betaproteobacteria bacterium]